MSYIYTIAQAAAPAEAGAVTTAAPVAAETGVATTATTVQPAGAPAPEPTPEEQQGGGMSFIIMLVVFFAIMYFLMIRPQKKQQKELKERQDGLKPGDKVVSAGGIFGIVREVKEQTIKMEIAPNTIIKIAKSSIVQTVAKDGSAEGNK